MSAHHIIWRLAATLTAIVAVVGTLAAHPVAPSLGIGVCAAACGAAMGLACRADFPRARHLPARGAASFVAPTLLPGLASASSPGTAAVLAVLLVVTAPPVSSALVDALRGRVLPSHTHVAGMAQHADALRRQWEQSTRVLETSLTLRQRLQIVMLREQILEELLELTGGVPPEYVWTSPRGKGGRGRAGIGS